MKDVNSMIKKGSTGKQEGTLALVAALVILFLTTWNPMIAAVVSIVALVLYGIYKLMLK